MSATLAVTQQRAGSGANRLGLSNFLRSSITFIVFLVLFAVLSLWLGGSFLSAQDRIFDLHQNVPLLVLGLAAVTILSVNQFDLSIGGMATLTAYLSAGLYADNGFPMWLAIVASLAVGVVGGLVNALLVVKMRINAFIATIGTGGVFLGASRVYGNGTVLVPDEGLPGWFAGRESFGSFSSKVPAVVMWVVLALLLVGAVAYVVRTLRAPAATPSLRSIRVACVVVGAAVAIAIWPTITGLVPLTVAFVLLVAIVMWLMFTRTVFGRYLYATGGNPRAARLAGVKVERQTTMAFVITGLLASVAGVVLAANQGSVAVDVAQPMLLPAYAAAFLSTVLLSTGRLHVWGCILGGLFVVWIRQALIIGGVPFTWAEVVNGGVLVAAVAASRLLTSKDRR
ncbi:ABC transporter permease [Pseudonocardia sulfidoxydans NBRC 16205]|uniref:Autoinducer 2 import system permease protein LsrD n=1 Tax=Pseudonocardia sulfidoxydans NBRC 16205 TaxID=1223511 RepID=A0A511DME5_9PSEU|nr:ABC transporter permease [Pseudonocardia sulfidoxydans]GEL24238.1 ABC transporter permease [Pseudonocardia sulfidoxydans NBRC 16205]